MLTVNLRVIHQIREMPFDLVESLHAMSTCMKTLNLIHVESKNDPLILQKDQCCDPLFSSKVEIRSFYCQLGKKRIISDQDQILFIPS